MTKTVMPAGRYYIGDLCYVMHEQWDEFCDKAVDSGTLEFKNGVKVSYFSTMYGDGTYTDNFGNEYPVDAGLIGCIKVEDIRDDDGDTSSGNIIEFANDFECFSQNGFITFGHIYINTSDENKDQYLETYQYEE